MRVAQNEVVNKRGYKAWKLEGVNAMATGVTNLANVASLHCSVSTDNVRSDYCRRLRRVTAAATTTTTRTTPTTPRDVARVRRGRRRDSGSGGGGGRYGVGGRGISAPASTTSYCASAAVSAAAVALWLCLSSSGGSTLAITAAEAFACRSVRVIPTTAAVSATAAAAEVWSGRCRCDCRIFGNGGGCDDDDCYCYCYYQHCGFETVSKRRAGLGRHVRPFTNGPLGATAGPNDFMGFEDKASSSSAIIVVSSSGGGSGSGSNDDSRKESRFGLRRRLRSALRASLEVNNETSSSSSSSSSSMESPLGVRRRVRSVLAKARSRTGIENNSEGGGAQKVPTASSASLGDNGGGGDDGGASEGNGRVGVSSRIGGAATPLKTTQSGLDVVAEAASIGGLGAVVVDDESGAIDVALDYVPLPVQKDGDERNVSNSVSVPYDSANGSSFRRNGTGISDADADAAAAAAAASSSSSRERTFTASGSKKLSLASTPSSPLVLPPEPNPEDSLVPARSVADISGNRNGARAIPSSSKSRSKYTSSIYTELDAFKGDVSAAFSMPPDPLPFTLPTLTQSQTARLGAGERLQFQADMGREGNGYVVLDVKAPPEIIWDTLLDFQSYPETIPTVRGVTMYTNVHKPDGQIREMALPRIGDRSYSDGTKAVLKHGVASVTRAAFVLSKFRLRIAAVHKYQPHPQGDYMVFTLDPTSSNVVLRSAKGVWHTQVNPDGKGEEYTRVWLLCELKVSPLLPQWITDYAAKRAMPRATTWLKPTVEAIATRQKQ